LGKQYWSGEELRTVGGGRALSLPSSSGGRGFTGNAILDEFAYHLDPRMVLESAGGSTTHGGKLRILSTPNGVGNLFHAFCAEPERRKGWRYHRTTLDEAIAQGVDADLDELWTKAGGDPRTFDQLYRCSFLDADEQYIPTEYIGDCSRPDTSQDRGPVYGGLDVGLKNDLTALVIGRVAPEMMALTRRMPAPVAAYPAPQPRVLSDDEVLDEPEAPAPLQQVHVRWVQQTLTWKRTSWTEQEKALDAVFEQWPIVRLCVDATGLGAVPAERLVARYGRRIEPVSFTAPVKEELATLLYTHFAEKRVRVPTHDAALRDDVCALRRIVTAAGNIRYDAARTAAGHADRAWALALMLHACTRPVTRRDLGALPSQ
jgi:phage FluMu gp28-like protein